MFSGPKGKNVKPEPECKKRTSFLKPDDWAHHGFIHVISGESCTLRLFSCQKSNIVLYGTILRLIKAIYMKEEFMKKKSPIYFH